MSQEQAPSILHYRGLVKDCGLHRALQIAAQDVDELRDALGRKLDRAASIAFAFFLAGCIVGALFAWVALK